MHWHTLWNVDYFWQEIYIKILGGVVRSEDSAMAGSVDSGVTGVAVTMLRDGPWWVQTGGRLWQVNKSNSYEPYK